jgi:hypothetical protein
MILRVSQKHAAIFLLISCLILSAILYSLYKFKYSTLYRELFQSNKEFECVVARYNENTDWFKEEPFNHFDMICYNKGPKLPDNCFTETCKVVNLDNVGRCDHTYLYHIIKNYNNLADVTIFLPASCMDSHKKEFTFNVIKHVLETKTTVLQGGILDDVRSHLYNFTLDEWKATNKENIEVNHESLLEKSPIRPFGKWYDANFGSDLKVKVFCFYGIIAVAREHITQHPIERYEKLIKYLSNSSNPEAGHYMERSWGAIFYPYPESCIYNAGALEQIKGNIQAISSYLKTKLT